MIDDMLVKRVPFGDFGANLFRVCLVRNLPRLQVRFDALDRGQRPHLLPHRRFDALLLCGQVGRRPLGDVVDAYGQHPA